jgi:hypothetical protein
VRQEGLGEMKIIDGAEAVSLQPFTPERFLYPFRFKVESATRS